MCAWVSTKPGTTVLPERSITVAPSGTSPGPADTDAMRLFVTTMSAFSTISSPFMVIARAPRSTTVPCGMSRSAVTAICCSEGSYSGSPDAASRS